MSTLAQTIRRATGPAKSRASDEEEADPKAPGATGDETEEEASDEEDETAADTQPDEEAEDDEEEEQTTATTSAPKYGLSAAIQTLELCAIAGVSARAAHGYVKARTPVAEVRGKLAAAKAPAAERLETSRPKNAAGAGWDDVVAKVNGILPPTAKR
ncbi:MAG: hypothetical protein LCH93_13775 [Proteobacteria bacterium]|nr:hypothetical protein [Pseudomonadota bacterium]